MFIDILRVTDASLVFSTPRNLEDEPASALLGPAYPPAARDKHNVSCAAATARRASLSAFAIVRRDTWEAFHGKVLARMASDPRYGAYIARGLEELVCALSARLFVERPACIEIHTPSTHVLDGRRAFEVEARADAKALYQLMANRPGANLLAPNAQGTGVHRIATSSSSSSAHTSGLLSTPTCHLGCAAALEAAYGTSTVNGTRAGTCCWAAGGRVGRVEAYDDSAGWGAWDGPSTDGTSSRLARCWLVGPMKEGLSLTRASFNRLKYQRALNKQLREATMAANMVRRARYAAAHAASKG